MDADAVLELIRADVAALRVETARMAAETVAARRELEQHRADDRRELDGLDSEIKAVDEKVGRLSRRQWLMAIATVMVAGGGSGAAGAAISQVMGG